MGNKDGDTQVGHSQTPVDDEIDLKELFMVLWSGKWLITATTGLAAATSVAALMLPNICESLRTAGSQGGMSALMQQYGGQVWLGFLCRAVRGVKSTAWHGVNDFSGFIGDFVSDARF